MARLIKALLFLMAIALAGGSNWQIGPGAP